MERTTAGSSGARWLWLTLALVALDRATKRVIERHTSPFFRRPIISDIVVVVHRENPGIAFSVFSDSHSRLLEPMLLLSSAVVIVLLIWVLLKDLVGGWLAQCGVAMILAGATGNALDRVLHGTVTDFLEVRLGAYRWPAFNVADSAITVGAILVGIELLFGNRETLDSAENSRESR